MLAAVLAVMGLGSRTVGRVTQLDPDYYQVIQTNDSLLLQVEVVAEVPRHRFYLEQPAPDTLLLYRPAAVPAPALRPAPAPPRAAAAPRV